MSLFGAACPHYPTESVSFSFIHTKDVPVSDRFSGFPFAGK
jgi:hypothetical protein